MARPKKTEDDFFELLASETGGGLLRDVGKVPYLVDTGNLSLNYICSGKFINGGIPGGRITEVYGPPASSKSLLGSCLIGACQRAGGIAILLDCERASNADFAAKAAHVDVGRLIVHEPISIEQCESKIKAITKAIRAKKKDVPILFIWDSIGVTPTEREWKETELPENFTPTQFKAIVGSKEKPGERARAAGDMLRVINPFLNENQATLFIVNQVRSKIGVMFGDPDTGAGGGRALEFYASCRLKTAAYKKIMEGETKDLQVPIGVNLAYFNTKSRGFTPGLSVNNVRLLYDKGISPISGLLTTLLKAKRIEAAGKGTYKVMDVFTPDEEIKFKSTKERDDVPLDVLYKCPSLIDAKSTKEVEEYMSVYMEAIAYMNSDNVKEVEASEEAVENLLEN